MQATAIPLATIKAYPQKNLWHINRVVSERHFNNKPEIDGDLQAWNHYLRDRVSSSCTATKLGCARLVDF